MLTVNEIEKEAIIFSTNYLNEDKTVDEFINELRVRNINFHNEESEILFLSQISQIISNIMAEHSKECKNPYTCPEASKMRDMLFFVSEMLGEYGFELDSDLVFSQELKSTINKKLEEFYKSIQLDNEDIEEQIREEIIELKSLYFLGIKVWKQILLGKAYELKTLKLVDEKKSQELISINQYLPASIEKKKSPYEDFGRQNNRF